MRASRGNRARRLLVVGRLEECFLCGGERTFVVFGRALLCPFCRGRGRVPVLTIGGPS